MARVSHEKLFAFSTGESYQTYVDDDRLNWRNEAFPNPGTLQKLILTKKQYNPLNILIIPKGMNVQPQ